MLSRHVKLIYKPRLTYIDVPSTKEGFQFVTEGKEAVVLRRAAIACLEPVHTREHLS